MALNDHEKKQLFHDLVDMTCGTYQPGDLTTKQQAEAILVLRCRLAKYSTDEQTRKEFGSLQPAGVLSQISKVPVEVVKAIADEFGLDLPDQVVIEDVDEDEEDFFDEEEIEADDQEEDFFNGEGARDVVDYIEKVLEMIKSGRIHAVSVAAVSHNGQASIWVPDNIDTERIQELFSPVIDALSTGPFRKPN